VQTSQALRGDLVFYEHPAHVTIIVARVNGVPMVMSHGKEEGPFYLRYNYKRPGGPHADPALRLAPTHRPAPPAGRRRSAGP
jgi:hypothetical protein